MADLDGGDLAVDLGQGISLRAPGLQGEAKLRAPRDALMRSRAPSREDGTEVLRRALEAAGMSERRQVELQLRRRRGAPRAARTLRSADGRQEAVELLVPVPEPGKAQVVLSANRHGVLRWHFPEESAERGAALRAATRARQRFVIPVSAAPPAAPRAGVQRAILGPLGAMLLKVLVYPIVDPVLGPIEAAFARRWEAKNRPYGLRDFTAANFQVPGGNPIDADGWKRLASGRALLFIHGTFSTAHGAFGEIDPAVIGELAQRYGGRVFAFNHFTLSDDPAENAKWLLQQLPDDGSRFEVDIACHSRGGLVARALAESPSAFGIDAERIGVRRIVFAAVPNQGTALAEAGHMVDMIDRFTTALNLVPAGPVSETLEVLVTVVKVIGHAGLEGLAGLAAMDPQGRFLARLNRSATKVAEGYGVAADYQPNDVGLKELVDGTIDAVADRIFDEAPNDLVVPFTGVFAANHGSAFPIPDDRLLRIAPSAGVMHTTIFRHAPTQQQLLAWLPG